LTLRAKKDALRANEGHMAQRLLPSFALVGMEDLVRELGSDPVDIALRSGFPVDAFADPDLPVAVGAAADFLERAALACDCPDFGLRLSQRQDLSILGPLFVLMSLAATVGDALGLLSQHMALHSGGLVINAKSVPEGLLLEYGIAYREAESDHQGMELGIALITNFVRGYQPAKWSPVYVQFRHARPANIALHLATFGSQVYFNQDKTSLCIDRNALAAPIHTSSVETKRLASRILRQQGCFDAKGVVNRTEAMVRALLPYGSDCTIASVANFLGMSTRSLQRSLADAEVTFEAMRDSIRADLAKKYLLQSTMSVAEIADVLGYSQPSAFARSFRRWHKVAPLRYRKAGGEPRS